MRWMLMLLLVPIVAGCAIDDPYEAPPMYGPPMFIPPPPPTAGTCSGLAPMGYAPNYHAPPPGPQTAEPPR